MSYAQAAGDFGTAVSDLYAAQGAAATASADEQAAALEKQNIQIEKESVNVQKTQQERQQYQSMSGTVAEAAGAGLSTSGSISSILRSSAAQGALAKNLIGIQGQIQENSFQAQEVSFTGQAEAAKAAESGDEFGAGFSAIGGVVSMFSM